MVIIIKYFKILSQSYVIIENMSESLKDGYATLPTHFKLFLDNLEKQVTVISDFLQPQHASNI